MFTDAFSSQSDCWLTLMMLWLEVNRCQLERTLHRAVKASSREVVLTTIQREVARLLSYDLPRVGDVQDSWQIDVVPSSWPDFDRLTRRLPIEYRIYSTLVVTGLVESCSSCLEFGLGRFDQLVCGTSCLHNEVLNSIYTVERGHFRTFLHICKEKIGPNYISRWNCPSPFSLLSSCWNCFKRLRIWYCFDKFTCF